MTDVLTPTETHTLQEVLPPEGPVWFYRFNPFARQRLGDDKIRRLLTELRAADRRVDEAATRAGEQLHELVGAAVDPQERKSLLAMSRALRRGKKLPDGPRPDAVGDWETAVAGRDHLLHQLHEVHPEAVRAERRALAAQLQDPHLSASLALVSPEVARQAARYVEGIGQDGTGSARLLKSERGLLQYVLRAAVRTSPLAQLTAVGLASVAPGGHSPDEPHREVERSFFSLDRVMLDYVLGGALAESAGLQDDPHVALPPTSAIGDGRLLFLVPSDEGYKRVGMPLRPPLAEIVGLLSLGPIPRSTLADLVSASLGEADASRVETFIAKALDGGALCTIDPTTDDDLVVLGDRGISALDPLLHELRRTLSRLETAPASDRAPLLDRAESTLTEFSQVARRPAKVAVTEDRIARLSPVDPQAWGSALDDLGPAVELLSTFDWLADVALALRSAFVSTYGAGARTPLLSAAPGLVARVTAAAEVMTRAYVTGEDPALETSDGPDATLAALYSVRRRIETEVTRWFDEAIEAGEDEVVLSPDDVHTMLAAMPDELRERALGYGVLVQSLPDGLVINDGLPGHGMLFSRFLGMDRALGGTALSTLRHTIEDTYGEPGVRLVEDRSLHNLNVNVHPVVLDDVLQPADWPRLTLEHDATVDRLQVMDGEQPIKVLPLGGGHPGMYPPPLSVASGIVIAGRLYNGLPDAYARRAEEDESATRRVPRMRVGQVVISRARWFPGADLDEALAVSDEQERLVALTRWRARHGVPDEVVVKSVPADAGPASVGSPEAQDVRFRSKPQYVDLTSALCVRVLPRMLQRRGGENAPAVYLEEAAPSIESGPHAAEWVVDVSRPRGGSFRYGGQS